MSAIKATFTLDATRYDQKLRQIENSARSSARRIEQSTAQSTVLNASKGGRDAAAQYVKYWEEALTKQDSDKIAAARAKRDNRAKLVEEYKASQERKVIRGKEMAEEMEMEAKLARARRMRVYQNLRLSKEARDQDLAGTRRIGGYGGATSAMLVSVARDTAASLASGANPVTVAMQQTPQLLQALTMSTKEGLRAMRDAFTSGIRSLVSKMGGAPGVALAAGGAVAAGATISAAVDAVRAMNEERETEANLAATWSRISGRLREMATKLYNAGNLSEKALLNIIAISGDGTLSPSEMIAKVRKNMPVAPANLEHIQESTRLGSDIMRKMFIDAIADPVARAIKQAELDRDIASRDAEQFEKQYNIPAEEYTRLVDRLFDFRVSEARASTSGPRDLGVRFGSRVEGAPDPKTVEMQNHVRTIKDAVVSMSTRQPKGDSVIF